MKTSHLIILSSLVFMGAAEGAPVAVPYIDSVGVLVGISPVTAATTVPPALLPAPPGTSTVNYKAQGKFFAPVPSLALEATNHEQMDFNEVLRIMADTPGERFQERMWKFQGGTPATVYRLPPVVILPPPVGNPNKDTPPRIQLDTLDLSPGAQVDMRTVPADMLPGR